MASFAVYLKTESGDGYLHAIEMKNFKGVKDAADSILDPMGDELAYVSDYSVALDNFSHGDRVESFYQRFREEIDKRIEQAISEDEK